MLIDVHAHINDKQFDGQVEEIIQNARRNGVEKIICVSDDLQSSQKALLIAEKYEGVFVTFGIHPLHAGKFAEEKSYGEFEKFVEQNADNEKVVGIGEIGLDYHYENFDKDKQKVLFKKQLELADRFGLPVQIHSRDATEDMLEFLKNNATLLKYGGIMHCFSGSLDTLNQLQKLNLKVSVGGVVTFKNAYSLHQLVEKMPLEMIMIETDCPYLTPHPYRGKRNEPKYVFLTAEKIAEIKDMRIKDIQEISTKNALDVFTKMK